MILPLPFEGKMASVFSEACRHRCVCISSSFVSSCLVLLWEVANQLHTQVFLE